VAHEAQVNAPEQYLNYFLAAWSAQRGRERAYAQVDMKLLKLRDHRAALSNALWATTMSRFVWPGCMITTNKSLVSRWEERQRKEISFV
jgi:hypothetical protein